MKISVICEMIALINFVVVSSSHEPPKPQYIAKDETKCTDQNKKRNTFEMAACAKKSTAARGSSQDIVVMSFIAVFSHGRGRCI